MEVICSGLNVVDLLVSIPNNVPYGQKTECDKIIVQGGAPAGNAASALAALGHETGFLGYFSDNTLSQIARSELQRFGVKDELFVHKEGVAPAIAIVQIDELGERTVLYSMIGYEQFKPKDVDESIFADCKLLLVDGYDTEINIHLLKLAKKHNIQSVLDLEAGEEDSMKELVSLASHAILPLECAQKLCKKNSIENCVLSIDKMTDAQVVITDGVNGSYAIFNGEVIHKSAYNVKAVDTTGCGDAYHAAFASALLQGMNIPDCMNYGSFFAAQVAKEFGGRTKFPTKEFMNQQIQKN